MKSITYDDPHNQKQSKNPKKVADKKWSDMLFPNGWRQGKYVQKIYTQSTKQAERERGLIASTYLHNSLHRIVLE